MQFNHRDFGERYVSDGLYGLIKLRLFAEEYERAVYELAKRIVSVADSVRIDTGRPVDYRLAPSAFGSPSSGVGAPRPMQITIAAPTRHDLPEGRNSDHYGDHPQDWNPYYPTSARPLAYVAEELVRSLNYQAVITSFDEDRHDGKAPPSTPEILLVDRWALRDEDHCRRLAAFDAENRPWVTMVVPWSRDDHQSRAAEAELTEKLEAVMPVKMGQGRPSAGPPRKECPPWRPSVNSCPRWSRWPHSSISKHAKAYPPGSGGGSGERTRLTGPMGNTSYIPDPHDPATEAEDL